MPSNADKRPYPVDFLEAPGLRRAARREITFDAARSAVTHFLRFDFREFVPLALHALFAADLQICFSMAARTSPSPGADAPAPEHFSPPHRACRIADFYRVYPRAPGFADTKANIETQTSSRCNN